MKMNVNLVKVCGVYMRRSKPKCPSRKPVPADVSTMMIPIQAVVKVVRIFFLKEAVRNKQATQYVLLKPQICSVV